MRAAQKLLFMYLPDSYISELAYRWVCSMNEFMYRSRLCCSGNRHQPVLPTAAGEHLEERRDVCAELIRELGHPLSWLAHHPHYAQIEI